jgi:hypothetical protein
LDLKIVFEAKEKDFEFVSLAKARTAPVGETKSVRNDIFGEVWREARQISPSDCWQSSGARVNKPTAEEMFSRSARHLVSRRICFC